ncbi:hypothetical protein GCM10010349_71670 [Streptomyces flavofungini]|nr:hypothetical protein GCM10010349_71670 [Streptomyces flavofungini]
MTPSSTTPEMDRIMRFLLVDGDSHHEFFQAHSMYPYDKGCKWGKFPIFTPNGGGLMGRLCTSEGVSGRGSSPDVIFAVDAVGHVP